MSLTCRGELVRIWLLISIIIFGIECAYNCEIQTEKGYMTEGLFLKFRTDNNIECQRLCWFSRLCSSSVWEVKTRMCQLFRNSVEANVELFKESGDFLYSNIVSPPCLHTWHGCYRRPCSEEDICSPARSGSANTCLPIGNLIISTTTTTSTSTATIKTTPKPTTTTTTTTTTSMPRTCFEYYQHDENRSNGHFELANDGGTIRVWCNFESKFVVTFFSKSAIANLTTSDLALHHDVATEVDVIGKWVNGEETKSTLEQLSLYSSLDLGIKANEHKDYAGPNNTILGDFLFLGFLPSTMANDSAHRTQGYRVNDVNKTFNNCDKNPNSYFTFFANVDGKTPTRNGVDDLSGLGGHWAKYAVKLRPDEYLSSEFFFFTELHFGGCGAFSTTGGWSEVDGLSLGLKKAL